MEEISTKNNLVKVWTKDFISTIEFNNPPVNTLSELFVEDFVQAIHSLNTKKTRVIIVKAQDNPKIFSAGHNIKELPLEKEDPLSYEDSLRVLIRAIQYSPKPIIAMVEGGVYGGAFETVMACDLVIASETASFAMTPVNIGMAYNLVGIQNLTHEVGLHNLKEMLFTATPTSAVTAEKKGLINYCVPAIELKDKVQTIAKVIVSKAPKSISLIKEELRILKGANTISPNEYERIQGMRKEIYYGHDYNEGLVSFLEKRPPEFIGE